MNRPPHPVLRRLYVLGAVPGATIAGLGRALASLTRMARDFTDAPLLSDRALAPLVQAIDLSGLFRQAMERPREQPSAGALVEPPRARTRRSRPAVRASSRGPEATVSCEPEVVAALLDRVAGAEEIAQRVDPSPAARPWPRGKGRAATQPTQPMPSRAQALSALHERARRAGSVTAVDTPIEEPAVTLGVTAPLEGVDPMAGGPAPIVAVTALLAGVDPAVRGRSATVDPRDAAAPACAPTPMARLESTLDRLDAVVPRREIAPRDVAEGPQRSRGLRPAGDGAEKSSRPFRATMAPHVGHGGLRGLAAVAAATRGGGNSGMPELGSDGDAATADFVAERAAEAELTRRIAALLDREARRQGVELEGLQP